MCIWYLVLIKLKQLQYTVMEVKSTAFLFTTDNIMDT